jgi:hypothetical protein
MEPGKLADCARQYKRRRSLYGELFADAGGHFVGIIGQEALERRQY